MTYGQGCEAFRFVRRNIRFVFAGFWAWSRPKSSIRNSVIRSSILGQIPLSGGYRVLSRSKTQVVTWPKRARNVSSDGRRNHAGAIKGAIDIHWFYPPKLGSVAAKDCTNTSPRCLDPSITIDPRALALGAGVLDRLAHHARESRRGDRVGRDPKAASRGAALKVCCVDREAQREMGENLLDFARQPPPARHDWRGVGKLAIWAFVRPRRPRQLDGRGEKTMSRSAASEKGPIGTAGEEHRALPAGSHLRSVAPGIGLGGSGP